MVDRYEVGCWLAIILCFAGAIGAMYGGIYMLRSATAINDNIEVTGVFEKLTIDGQDVTITFKDYSSVTFWQSDGLYSISGNSLQVPFIEGHEYKIIFAVHGQEPNTYLTLQSVVEVQ